MDPIVTITEYPHVGRFAKARPVEPGGVTVKFASMETGSDTGVSLVVVIPGIAALNRSSWEKSEDITVSLKLPAPVKNGPNRESRAQDAIAKLLEATGNPVRHLSGCTIGSQAVVNAINAVVTRRVDQFNEEFHGNAQRMVRSAAGLYDKDTFPVERAKVDTLEAAAAAIRELLSAARDQLHATARAQMLEGFKEIGAPLDYEKLATVQREKHGFFAG